MRRIDPRESLLSQEKWLDATIASAPRRVRTMRYVDVEVDGAKVAPVSTLNVRIAPPGVARGCGCCGDRFYVHPAIPAEALAGSYCDACYVAKTEVLPVAA